MYLPPAPTREAQDQEMDRMRTELYELSVKYENVMKMLSMHSAGSPSNLPKNDTVEEFDEEVEDVLGDMCGPLDELQNKSSNVSMSSLGASDKDVSGPFVPKGKSVKLASGTIDNIVAKGILLESGDSNVTVHGVPLSIENVRVSITTVIKTDALLPIPVHDELVLVSQALGSFVAWPKKLVISSDFRSAKDITPKPQPPAKPSPQKFLYMLLLFVEYSMEESLPIHKHMDNGIVFAKSSDTYVMKEDLQQFCSMEAIYVQIIIVYMRFLYYKLKASNADNLYLLVEPGAVSASRCDNLRSTDLAVRMETCKDSQLVVFPFNINYLWMLVVIYPFDRNIYYFDPLGNQPPKDLISFVTTAYKVWCCGRGEKCRPLSWTNMKCSLQPNQTECCGYYVMKYMKDLFQSRIGALKNKLDSKQSYSTKDVNEMRGEFAEYVLGVVNQNLS